MNENKATKALVNEGFVYLRVFRLKARRDPQCKPARLQPIKTIIVNRTGNVQIINRPVHNYRKR